MRYVRLELLYIIISKKGNNYFDDVWLEISYSFS
jgi:hypothetical protein